MTTPLRVLIIEDSENDAELLLLTLRRGGYAPEYERVETPEGLEDALARQSWDIIISDYSMPRLNGVHALKLVQEKGVDIPFILVSGAIGQDVAVAAMRAGARDYLMKDDLARLLPAIERELCEAVMRQEGRQAEEKTCQLHTDLLASERYLRTIVDAALDAVITINDKGLVTDWNMEGERIFGYSRADAVGKPLESLIIPPPMREMHRRGLERFLKTGVSTILGKRIEVTAMRAGGGEFPVEMAIVAVKSGDTFFFNTFLRDITKRKQSEEEIRQLNVATLADLSKIKAASDEIKNLAFYDPLTQLPNRRLFHDRLNQAMVSGARSGQRGALLFLDLDHFKILNDTLGHDVGDLLLRQVAERLTICLREGDTTSRLGGDEFVVLLEDLGEQAIEATSQTKVVAEKILLSLNQPYQLGTHRYHSTVSIGATLFEGHKRGLEVLLKQADIAMYQSKSAGRNTLRFFDPNMQEYITKRADMANELRMAIERNQLKLHYQVQVDSSGQTLGAEALIRWIHPERGMISPFNFIPLAEDTGLILPIGQWVLDTACAQIKAWQQNPLTKDLTLSVNVSTKQFYQVDFVEQVLATIARHNINPSYIKLELTESVLVHNINDIITKMNALSTLGIRFSLDDFGTGYSSLQYLKLPLDQLKIDQSFVRDIATDNSDRVIVHTIITMAQSLGIN
ncbi:MAG: EAL domain-containing protein, partial [Deltaproteobacteria bacterium]